jgi:hypothetical protein
MHSFVVCNLLSDLEVLKIAKFMTILFDTLADLPFGLRKQQRP